MKKYAIAALAIVALGAAIAFAQTFTMPPPAGVTVGACVFNSVPPTLTSGTPGMLQCDSTGELIISGGGGGGGGNVVITSPLGHTTADAAAVATVPSATANFPSSQLETDFGAPGATACTTDTASCSLNQQMQRVAQRLTQVDTDINVVNVTAGNPLAAGTNLIGKVGIDQTTPGTTNAVALIGGAAVATAAAPPANTVYIGANASGATGGHIAGLISCDNHVFKHITSATDTIAIQGVTSQIVYICGWRSRAAGTATWFLENTASINANCSSSNTQITGVASEVANSGETLLAPFWTGLKNTVGNGLCINSTGTGGVDVDIWYTQF